MNAMTVVGLAGFAMYVGTYALLVTGRLDGNGRSYQAGNLIAAVLMLISLTATFHLGSAMIQVTWIVLSLVGIVRPRDLSARLTRPEGTPVPSVDDGVELPTAV